MFAESLLIAVLTAAGVAVGWALGRRGQGKAAGRSAPAALPDHWPLQARPLVNHNESIIWRWVRASFPSQRVLVKLPFSRFTSPAHAQVARAHYDLLNGLYATFTIADREGRVLGCIDLVDRQQGLSSSQRLKQGILADLGIGYEVIQGTDLPSPAVIRMAILSGHGRHGPESVPSVPPTDNAQLLDARSHLQQLLDRQRDRRADFRPSELGDFRPSDLAALTDADPPTSWQAPLR
jgi:hypothetical protein